MPTLTDRHFALKVLFPKITCRDDWIACGDHLERELNDIDYLCILRLILVFISVLVIEK
jgi:hypothetical protein